MTEKQKSSSKALKLSINALCVALLVLSASGCASSSNTRGESSVPPALTPYQQYIQELNDRVDPFWKQELKSQLEKAQGKSSTPAKTLIPGQSQVTCSVEIKLDRTGVVKRVKLGKTSGFKTVDAAAISAIKKASPLPAPPAAWVKGKTAIIRWEFVLKDQ